MTDQQRAKELRQLLSTADDVVGWRTPTIAMLATAQIVRQTDGRSEVVTDLDGMIGYFIGGQLFWLVVETKKSGVGTGAQQLQDRVLASLDRQSAVAIQHREFGPEETWFVTIPARGGVDASKAIDAVDAAAIAMPPQAKAPGEATGRP